MTKPKGMPRDHFDVALLPQDATAAMVVADEPEYNRVFEDFMKRAGHLVFHAPDVAFLPRTFPTQIESMIGRRFGQLVVIGYHRRKKGPQGQRISQTWWCRCECGLYCLRTTKTIKKADPAARCAWCEKKEYLRERMTHR